MVIETNKFSLKRIGDRPLIQHVVDMFRMCGFYNFIVVKHPILCFPGYGDIATHYDYCGSNICIVNSIQSVPRYARSVLFKRDVYIVTRGNFLGDYNMWNLVNEFRDLHVPIYLDITKNSDNRHFLYLLPKGGGALHVTSLPCDKLSRVIDEDLDLVRAEFEYGNDLFGWVMKE